MTRYYGILIFYHSHRPGYEYRIGIRLQGTGSICVDFDAQTFSEKVTVDEGRWSIADLGTVTLAKGQQVMRLFIHDGCFTLNWVEIMKA